MSNKPRWYTATKRPFLRAKVGPRKEDNGVGNETRTKEAVVQERGGLMRRKGWGTCAPTKVEKNDGCPAAMVVCKNVSSCRQSGSSNDRIWIPPVLGKYCLPSFFSSTSSTVSSFSRCALRVLPYPSLSFLLPHYTYSPRNTCTHSVPCQPYHVLALAKLPVKTFVFRTLAKNGHLAATLGVKGSRDFLSLWQKGGRKKETRIHWRDRIYQPRN